MKYRLSIILIIASAMLLNSCSAQEDAVTDTPSDSHTEQRSASLLTGTADAGQEYIDSLIFLGESTTYHLKSRAVLTGGSNTRQVWAPRGGTANLDATVSSLRIVYPPTGQELTVREAVARERPKRMILTFGLNGAVTKIKKGEEYFRSCYLSLINEIRAGCDQTRIVLQSCFPIAASMDTRAYGVDAATLCGYISQINTWTYRLSCDEGLGYLNTAEALIGSDGFLLPEYDAGDGHHLSVSAYRRILEYIRTHEDKE